MIKNIILASGSPRRRELLSGLGWEFCVEPSRIEEKKIDGEAPDRLVRRLAMEKAAEVASRFPGNWVIGADTVVVIGDSVLGKPHSVDEAESMLRLLSGRMHSVFTGVALISPDGRRSAEAEETRVFFRRLSLEEISAYVACGESMDKAGAYAIQDKGTLLAEKVEGCYFNVVGLPLSLLSGMFADMGITLAEQWRK